MTEIKSVFAWGQEWGKLLGMRHRELFGITEMFLAVTVVMVTQECKLVKLSELYN